MSNELMNINNVRGYLDEDGVVQLNLDDIARGLGFTTVATSGNACIRWSRVESYLDEFGFSQLVGKEGFVPENIFYKLCFKAKNKTAIEFQNKITDEILPAIRKTGQYATKQPASIEDLIIMQAQSVKELKETVAGQQERLNMQQEAITNIKETIIGDAEDEVWRQAVKSSKNRIVNATGRSHQEVTNESYKVLESQGGCNLTTRLINLRDRLVRNGAGKTKVNNACKLDCIKSDKKLKAIYTRILREMSIRYTA